MKVMVLPELNRCEAVTIRSGRCRRVAGYLVPVGDRRVLLCAGHAAMAQRGPVALWDPNAPPPVAHRAWTPWTAEEDAHLLAHRSDRAADVALALGRTTAAVKQRLSRLVRRARDAGAVV